jgi:hypothetical protein
VVCASEIATGYTVEIADFFRVIRRDIPDIHIHLDLSSAAYWKDCRLPADLPVDSVSLSAQYIGGPSQVSALWFREGRLEMSPFQHMSVSSASLAGFFRALQSCRNETASRVRVHCVCASVSVIRELVEAKGFEVLDIPRQLPNTICFDAGVHWMLANTSFWNSGIAVCYSKDPEQFFVPSPFLNAIDGRSGIVSLSLHDKISESQLTAIQKALDGIETVKPFEVLLGGRDD